MQAALHEKIQKGKKNIIELCKSKKSNNILINHLKKML